MLGLVLEQFPSSIIFAYLDPGTGSFALQLLIAGLLSGVYAFRHSWYRFKALVLRRAGSHD